MLKQRVFTSLLLVLALVSLLFLAPPLWWWLLSLLIAAMAAWEWAGLAGWGTRGRTILSTLVPALGLLMLSGFWFSPLLLRAAMACVLLALLLWLLLVPALLAGLFKMPRNLIGLLGAVMLLAMWWAFGLLRVASPRWLLVVIAVVAIADSAAYLFGQQFGRHKLAPAISPGKTWEGVAGAWLGVSLFWLALYAMYGVHLWLLLVFWIILVLSIVGDLFESLLKRQAGLKDSGNLLPGHGGILDRIDGLFPVLPFTVVLISLFDFSLIHG